MQNTNAEFLKYAYALGAAQAMADAEKEAGFKEMLVRLTNAGRGVARGAERVGEGAVLGAERVGKGIARGAERVGKGAVLGAERVGKGAHNALWDPRVVRLAIHLGKSPSYSLGSLGAKAITQVAGEAFPRFNPYSSNAGKLTSMLSSYL